MSATAGSFVQFHCALSCVAATGENTTWFSLDEEETVGISVAGFLGVVFVARRLGAFSGEDETRFVGEASLASSRAGDVDASGTANIFAEARDLDAGSALRVARAVGFCQANGSNTLGEVGAVLTLGILEARFDGSVTAQAFNAST